jgi:hypothetical protein
VFNNHFKTSMSASSSSSDAPQISGHNRTLLFRELPSYVTAKPLALFLEHYAKVRQLTIPAPDGEPLG